MHINKNRRSRWACLAMVMVMLVCLPAIGSDGFFFFTPDRENAVFDLDKPVPQDALYFKDIDNRPYLTGMYYQFDNEDGSDFFCHFLYMDMGYGIKRLGLDYKLKRKDGTMVYFGRKYELSESNLGRDHFEFKVGPNIVNGDHKYHHLKIVDGPVKADVVLKTEVPFYRVGEEGKHCLTYECKEFGVITYFPLFSVTGTVEENGKKTMVSGWGYGNRSIQTHTDPNFTNFHTALRWQKDGLGFDLHDYTTLAGEWLPILMVYNNGKMIHVSQSYKKENIEFYKEPRSGKRIPIGYKIVSEGHGVKVQIEFTGVKLTDYNDPLVVLSPIEKSIVQLFVHAPLDMRFDGHVKLTLNTKTGTVVKEGPAHGLALMAK